MLLTHHNHSPSGMEVRAQIQDRNLEAGTEVEAMEKMWLTDIYRLASMVCSV